MDQNLLPPQMESKVILTSLNIFRQTRTQVGLFRVFCGEPIWFLPLVWAARRNSHQWYVHRPRLPIKTQKDHIHMSLFVLSCVFSPHCSAAHFSTPPTPANRRGCVRERVSCWSELQAYPHLVHSGESCPGKISRLIFGVLALAFLRLKSWCLTFLAGIYSLRRIKLAGTNFLMPKVSRKAFLPL